MTRLRVDYLELYFCHRPDTDTPIAETVAALHELYIIRAVGGVMYLSGALIMGYNVWMTIAGRQRLEMPMGAMPNYDPDQDRPITRPATAEPAE